MMNFICSIPENIGWMLVGMTITATAFMFGYLVKDIYHAIKDRLTESEEVAYEE